MSERVTLDRVRRRTTEGPPIRSAARDGKQALYSPVESHPPLPGPHRSWMRCPACRRRGWVAIRLRW